MSRAWNRDDLAAITKGSRPYWEALIQQGAFQRWGHVRSRSTPIENCLPHFPRSLQALADAGYNLTDIGAMLGLTRERIRQFAVRFAIRRFPRETPPRVWDDVRLRFRPLTKREERQERMGRSKARWEAQYGQEAFWAKVDIRGPTECWVWQGRRFPSGYGGWRNAYAHRVAYLSVYGEPDERCICHRCDNPPCVNPGHLFAGSFKDNIQDAISKGRFYQHRMQRNRKTLCRYGHVRDLERGVCPECRRAYAKRGYWKRKHAAQRSA